MDNRTDDQKAKDALKMLDALKKIRAPFEPVIEQIYKYVTHGRTMISTKNTGEKTGTNVYDGTALSAINLLVDGMVGYLCSRNIRWFGFRIPAKFQYSNGESKRLDQIREVQLWLQECEDAQYAAYSRSNFYDVVSEFIRDGAGAGTAHFVAEDEVGEGRISFIVPHFRECYIAENRYGKVDTNYRKYALTLRQLVDKFGMDRMKQLDRGFEKSYKENCHAEREVLHAVYPRKDRDPHRIDKKNKAFASEWVLVDKEKLIEEGGYDSMPTITWRWRKNNNEVYGRSPSWDALVPIILSNQQSRTNLIAAHKMADPPMGAFKDLRGKVRNMAGGITWIEDVTDDIRKKMPMPLQTGIQLPFAIESLERTDKAIRDHYGVDFFMMLTTAMQNNVEMTATQVIEMMGEKAAILSTRVGMLQSEALDPVHDRTFDIEMKAGRMPKPPDILYEAVGARIEVEYLGALSQAQMRHSKTRSIQAGLLSLSQIAQIDPTALDVVDLDQAARESIEASGFPVTCIRTPEMIQSIREQRQQAQKEQEEMAAIPEMAKAYRHAGAKPEEGSAAEALMGKE